MSNKKHKWTDKEEKDLLKYITANKQLEYISKKLKINDKLIINKLKKFAVKLLGKKTKEEIISLLKLLTDEQVEKIIERQNKKKLNSWDTMSRTIFWSTTRHCRIGSGPERRRWPVWHRQLASPWKWPMPTTSSA